MSAWIAVDLDETLAEFDYWRGEFHIGKPIKKTIIKIKNVLKKELM